PGWEARGLGAAGGSAERSGSPVQVSAEARLGRRLRSMARPKQEDPDHSELYGALDEELAGLPERLRVPLMLRYLESKTLEEVAHIVGCSRRDLGRRLARGETLLRQRFERRGLAVGACSL